jgi:hypothetical protein
MQQMTALFDFWAKSYDHFSEKCTSYYGAACDLKQDSSIPSQMQSFICWTFHEFPSNLEASYNYKYLMYSPFVTSQVEYEKIDTCVILLWW